MTLTQLFAFAESDPRGPARQLGLTVEAARSLVREIEAMQAKDCPEAFDLAGHVERQNSKGDVRNEFGRRVERGML